MNYTYKDMNYSLTQTDRKTISIYVEPGGIIRVRAPKTLSLEEINKKLDSKRYWIYKSITELDELNKAKVERNFTDGEGFIFMGKNYRLKIKTDQKEPLSLSENYFILNERNINSARKLFISFYKKNGIDYLSKRVEYFKKKLGVEPQRVRVVDLRKRWGSKSKTGLNFHWKIMMAPLDVIDYVVVHELVHYIQEDHNDDFWDRVASIIPDYKDKKDWLMLNGASLDI